MSIIDFAKEKPVELIKITGNADGDFEVGGNPAICPNPIRFCNLLGRSIKAMMPYWVKESRGSKHVLQIIDGFANIMQGFSRCMEEKDAIIVKANTKDLLELNERKPKA